MCFEPCKVVIYNRIIVHEGTGGQETSCKMLLSLHYMISVLNKFVLLQQKNHQQPDLQLLMFLFFSSQKPQERNALLMKSKTLSLPPSESQNTVGPSHRPHSTRPPPWSLIKFSPVLPCFCCGRIRKPSLLNP